MNEGIAEGIRLFNRQKYFEAHEALESVWLKAQGSQKAFLHGLIQVAAAFHHHTRGNPAGFRSLLEKGCAKLEEFGAAAERLDLSGLMLELRRWREYLGRSSDSPLPLPLLPRIKSIKEPRTSEQ
jgi:predicted metal-dependent hydrolase